MTNEAKQDANGAPVILTVGATLSVLERRQDHLEKLVASGQRSEAALEFSRREIAALKAARRALEYHRAVVGGLDTPLKLLRKLVDLGDARVDQALTREERIKLRQLVVEAKTVLQDFPS